MPAASPIYTSVFTLEYLILRLHVDAAAAPGLHACSLTFILSYSPFKSVLLRPQFLME